MHMHVYIFTYMHKIRVDGKINKMCLFIMLVTYLCF